MKKSFSLFESIIVLILSTFIIYTVLSLNTYISYTNDNTYINITKKLEIETTKLFLENKIIHDTNLSMLGIKEDILYYNDAILLKNITHFEKDISNNYCSINFCIKTNSELCIEFIINNKSKK